MDIGCGAAKGLTQESGILQSVWEKVQSLNLIREDGGSAFKYWGYEAAHAVVSDPPSPSDWVFTTQGLIDHRDGRCGGWASFMNDLMAVQGIISGTVALFPVSYYGENDQGETISISNGVCTHNLGCSVVYIKQIPDHFQGRSDLETNGEFLNHAINIINNAFYDATTGKGPYNTLYEYVYENLKLVYYVGSNAKTISGNNLAQVCFTN